MCSYGLSSHTDGYWKYPNNLTPEMPTKRQNLCTHKNEDIFEEHDNIHLVKVSIV